MTLNQASIFTPSRSKLSGATQVGLLQNKQVEHLYVYGWCRIVVYLCLAEVYYVRPKTDCFRSLSHIWQYFVTLAGSQFRCCGVRVTFLFILSTYLKIVLSNMKRRRMYPPLPKKDKARVAYSNDDFICYKRVFYKPR